MILRPEIARVFVPLLAPARYKGARGGRGSGKSHFFAEQLVLRCALAETRAVGIREIQRSLKESVRQLLIDKIAKFGLEAHFDVLEREIRGRRNRSLISFQGMQAHTAESIKSLEGYDIAWVEEAQSLSALSLRLLRPTLRKQGSELWFSWNPRHDSDPVDLLFRGPVPPPDATCIEANWYDNPWFPEVLRAEKDRDYADDAEMAEHVWGGGYEILSEGAYYARLIAEAEREGRIGRFAHDPARPVFTAWDIGVDDYTAIWFLQDDGNEATVIDYYEASGEGAEAIVRAALPELIPDAAERAAGLAALGRTAPFAYGRHFLPHDVKNREWGAGGRSRVEVLTALGVRPIRRGARMGPAERIAASRVLIPLTRFDRSKRVELGLTRLRRYRRKLNDALGAYTAPLHDINSHGADAFGEYALNARPRPLAPKEAPRPKDDAIYADETGAMRSTRSINEMIEDLSKKRTRR